jgi:hypothetical protein
VPTAVFLRVAPEGKHCIVFIFVFNVAFYFFSLMVIPLEGSSLFLYFLICGLMIRPLKALFF